MRSRKATGRNATYPSRNRIIDRDQRAVVIRCTATNITPADDTVVNISQLKCMDCHARPGARKSPATNASKPITDSTTHAVLTHAATGFAVPARISSRVRCGA